MRRGARALAAGAAVAVAFTAFAGAARADDVSGEEFERLVARAQADPAAVSELERVESVDGRPVDLRAALAGAERDELAERLETLSEGTEARGAASATDARREAREILSERRFHETDVPRPFRGILLRLGDALREAFEWLAERVPGGRATVWTVLAALVVGAAAFAAAKLARRRAGRAVERERLRTAPDRADPRALEREADEAERGGELERALRLRFRAGLIRLDRARAIDLRDSLTSGEVRRRLRSAEFDRLADTFDEVVYGRRPPSPPDVEASRRGWPRVLAEVGGR